LILHFWSLEAECDTKWSAFAEDGVEPNPIEYLQRAYERTIAATSKPNEWHGTATACAAILTSLPTRKDALTPPHPVLYVTNLGDSQILVLRPRQQQIIYKTAEQWHWFDCPRQLGTNSPDTPRANAVMDRVDIEEEDVVLAMSDGVVDNLWEHEVLENVVESVRKWEAGEVGQGSGDRRGGAGGGMQFVATELMKAARVIAEDPFAESPYMERAVEEGLPMEGGLSDCIPEVYEDERTS
jgi:protein phosphatase PTC7